MSYEPSNLVPLQQQQRINKSQISDWNMQPRNFSYIHIYYAQMPNIVTYLSNEPWYAVTEFWHLKYSDSKILSDMLIMPLQLSKCMWIIIHPDESIKNGF